MPQEHFDGADHDGPHEARPVRSPIWEGIFEFHGLLPEPWIFARDDDGDSVPRPFRGS